MNNLLQHHVVFVEVRGEVKMNRDWKFAYQCMNQNIPVYITIPDSQQ